MTVYFTRTSKYQATNLDKKICLPQSLIQLRLYLFSSSLVLRRFSSSVGVMSSTAFPVAVVAAIGATSRLSSAMASLLVVVSRSSSSAASLGGREEVVLEAGGGWWGLLTIPPPCR